VAVLGTVLDSAYRGGLTVTGLPAASAAAARSSVAGGSRSRTRLSQHPCCTPWGVAYVHGMDIMLWVCAGIRRHGRPCSGWRSCGAPVRAARTKSPCLTGFAAEARAEWRT